MSRKPVRLGADIGGTFTDIALEVGEEVSSVKVLTDQTAPANSVMQGIFEVTRKTGLELNDLDMIIHGTTLATNALIERRGAKTAFITTEGFRDVIEMRTENRFDQYDLNITFNSPLVPRQHRFPVKGRIDANGQELEALDEDAVEQLASFILDSDFESVAVGFIHSYLNSSHEQRAGEILESKLADIPISLSSEVAPQMREYPRFCTVCANAYVRPRIERYLIQLQHMLEEKGASCPIYVIHSAGGLISIDTAKKYPIRLVESGPAGGANFAAAVSARFGLEKIVSFDMGGTTAKICLIEDSKPETSQQFEVARSHRFKKGSGMPIMIPVIEMIEIGAGGGSIARVDSMDRIQVGPESAGSEPGPACYQRGGQYVTVTDADVVLGKIDPDNFAGESIKLSKSNAISAIDREISETLSLDTTMAAYGVSEVVDENMSNAARVHAVENGQNISEYTMVAFGGAAPLHAARICEKLGVKNCLIPKGAGVGSAIGFLQTPFSYETVVSQVMSLENFDAISINSLLSALIETAMVFVRAGTSAPTVTEITAFMRYQGQGWEIPVPLPKQSYASSDVTEMIARFEVCYSRFFGRTIDLLDDLEIEIVSWSVKVVEKQMAPKKITMLEGRNSQTRFDWRSVIDPESGEMTECKVINRYDLSPGDRIEGPAVIFERETSTIVTSNFHAVVQKDNSILLTKIE